MKRWPFPGDSILIRARKVALAYRHLAAGQEQQLARIRELYAQCDDRLIAWEPNEAARKELDGLMRTATPADDTVAALDRRFDDWGETWHADVESHYEPEDWVPADVAGQILSVSRNTVGRHRVRGRIEGKFLKQQGNGGGGWYYKVADLYELQTQLRGRGRHFGKGTVTVPSSGSSDE